MKSVFLIQKPTFDHWRDLAAYWKLSSKAKERLEWMIFYQTVGKGSSRFTANYFGVSEKTFWKWKSRFNPKFIQSLEEKSRAPRTKRTWTVTEAQEGRIIGLRQEHIKYGKKKLKILYEDQFKEQVSTWKIERVVRKHNLYPDPEERKKKLRRLKRRVLRPKVRIHELKNVFPGITLWHTDSVAIWWYGQRRTIFTAIEDSTKLAFARVYPSASSRQASDFLQRLVCLTNGKLKIIHSDNGSEFAGEFEKACFALGISQVYSRARTPKDNPSLERFNWTVQDEWLSLSEVGLDDINEANLDLTNWLIEYNFKRPHETLDYKTPIQYAQIYKSEVLPMSPAGTIT
ncbi:transposase [Candidatus Woesebacteria bacterium]|nr:transposase [Candidatus Woesebacteria bacterium]